MRKRHGCCHNLVTKVWLGRGPKKVLDDPGIVTAALAAPRRCTRTLHTLIRYIPVRYRF